MIIRNKTLNKNSFLALIFRMKHINRWNLMSTIKAENLSQHSSECAFLSHYLALIGNKIFHKSYDVNTIITCALYHDLTEVITGDVPTPVKYYNAEIQNNFKNLEKVAADTIINHLPDELKSPYEKYIYMKTLSPEEKNLIKIADKICAFIKCAEESNLGNKEFTPVMNSILSEIRDYNSVEANYFFENNFRSFFLSLDELKK